MKAKARAADASYEQQKEHLAVALLRQHLERTGAVSRSWPQPSASTDGGAASTSRPAPPMSRMSRMTSSCPAAMTSPSAASSKKQLSITEAHGKALAHSAGPDGAGLRVLHEEFDEEPDPQLVTGTASSLKGGDQASPDRGPSGSHGASCVHLIISVICATA
jgi:hypothetical protein